MPRVSKKELAEELHGEVDEIHNLTEKERLLILYKQLQDLGIRSISDLENLIAKAE